MGFSGTEHVKIVPGDAGYVLEDVPHLSDFNPDLPTYPNPLQHNPAYSVVKQYSVNVDDTVAQKIVVHKNSPRGTHFQRAGPRQKSFSMGAPNAYNITSRREMGSGRSMAISTRFSFNLFLFLLALVILSDVIMVAHCKPSCGLESCSGGATEGCCKEIDLCISTKSCGALCGERNSYNLIDNGLIRKCYENWRCGVCEACECK